jgi:streptogramin lyase
MSHKRLVTASFALMGLLVLTGPALAGLEVQETPLSLAGWAYELNLDSQGTLWVSDTTAGEIRSFDTASGARTAYLVGGAPSDARGDGVKSVWWADYTSNRLGRLSTASKQASIWEIPGSYGLYSTAIDSSGNVWVSDYYASFIYELDPGANQLCMYALPDYGVSEYLYVDGQTLWFGDLVNARIVRLQNDTFDWWNLPAGSYPRDLEMDGDGRLWWTDAEKNYLGRLDGAAATITTFTPPAGGTPVMLALSGDNVWYSQQDPSGVVELDPGVAASQTMPVTTGGQAAAPDCDELPPLAPIDIPATSGQASWTGQTYPTAIDAGGWVVYDMPGGSEPWGISAAGDEVWLVDSARKVLARLSPSAPPGKVYLPLLPRQ